MRKLLLFMALLPLAAKAQVVANFESLSLSKPDTFYVNYTQPGQDVGFNDGPMHFPCVYDTAFGGTWTTGFAYSNMTDSVTSGYMNQYSAKTAKGYNGSAKYAVYWQGYGAPMQVKRATSGTFNPAGFYITNSTYAYNSMLKGDAPPAKKFGGTSGNDTDFFKLTIYGHDQANAIKDSVVFYLADYRFSNNAQDYIIKNWTWVNLLPLGPVNGLSFKLTSSDNHPTFGMNTPAYFCMDDMGNNIPINAVGELPAQHIARVYPNPATDLLMVDVLDASVKSLRLMDMSGRLIAGQAATTKTTFSLTGLPAGMYVLQLAGDNHQTTNLRIVKQ